MRAAGSAAQASSLLAGGTRADVPDLSMQKAGLPVDKAQQITKEPVGLETPISDEEGIHRGDFIRDENAIMPLDIAIQASLRGAASKARSSLTP